ncbi:MAG: hypothetical protein IKN66_07055 [Ruminococcus sp.]|nr:hypothetical protein [Ruminococcus sp.]
MAAQGSFKRINNYSKVLSKHCRKQSVLIYILCGLQAFFMLFRILAFDDSNGAYTDFYVIGRLFGIAAALSGVLIIPAVFRELYNRQFADVEYSLPMSASERFSSKLLTLLKNHLLPFIICQTAVLVLGIIMLSAKSVEMLVHVYLDNLLDLLFTDAVSLLCVSCCGCLAECIYTPLFSAAALSLLFPLLYNKFIVILSGRIIVSETVRNFYIGYPMINNLIINGELFDLPDNIYNDSTYSVSPAVWIIPLVLNLLICIGLIYLAFRIYRKRSGLNTGKPMVFKAFRTVFIALVTLTVILVFFMNSFYLSIFVGMLIFLGISITSNRAKISMRDLAFMMAGYLGCLAAVLITGFISYITGGFGHLRAAVPDEYNSDNAYVTVYMVSEDYEYKEYLVSRKMQKCSKEGNLPESAVADIDDINTVFDEVGSLDKRFKKSLGENIADYLDLVRYEDNYSYYLYDKTWSSGDIEVAAEKARLVGENGNDPYFEIETREKMLIHVDLETLENYRSKLESRGFLSEKYSRSEDYDSDYVDHYETMA